MVILIVGLILFFSLHSLVIFAPQWREQKRQAWGRTAWNWFFAVGSIVAVALIAWGYGRSRYEPIVVYVTPYWMRRVTDVLMLAVFPMIFATFMPCRIRNALKYPDLVAIKLWAFAHLLVNGMLADLFLFGGFLAWAVVNRISLKRRVRVMPAGVPSEYNDLVAVVAGLVTYLFMVVYGHLKFIGVSPI